MPDLLLELRSEEIPARMQRKAAGDLRKMVTDGLVEAGLTYEGAREHWTPRRLALDIRGVTARSKDVREERKGPRTDAPGKAIEGFLRSAGLDSVDETEIRSDPKKGDFYVAVISKPGRGAEEIVAEMMPDIIRGFPWPKSMRWGPASAKPGSLRWVRPLQSIVCTFGPETGEPVVVDFEIDGIPSGNVTYGHRFHAPGPVEVRRFEDYVAKLEAAKVIVDAERRKRIILDDAKNLAFAAGLELVEDEALLEEVAGLVEWPVVLMGEFEEEFLDIPVEVVRLTIRANQKCFVCSPISPLVGEMSAKPTEGGTHAAVTPLSALPGISPTRGEISQSQLSNRFVITANIEAKDGGREIAAGNGKVVRARLSDALYFWKTDQGDLPDLERLKDSAGKFGLDLKKPLDQRMARLDHLGVTFHAKLGTQGERVERIRRLAGRLAPIVGADAALAERAALLAKADLQTEVVGEFPELQGAMGRKYAALQGEHPSVAAAIEEHYKPVGPSDVVPTDPVSIAVALADKLDTLVGFWAIDEKPTGSKDPYALRRAALGVIRIVVENGIRLGLNAILISHYTLDLKEALWRHYGERIEDYANDIGEIASDLLSFFHDRLNVYLRDKGARHDLIDAVLASGAPATPISPPVGEMSPKVTEGGTHAAGTPPSALPGISPTKGEISQSARPRTGASDRMPGDVSPGPAKASDPRLDPGERSAVSANNDDLLLIVRRVEALSTFLDTEDGKNLLAGTKRAANILSIEEKKGTRIADAVDPALLTEKSEITLFAAMNQAEKEAGRAIQEQDFSGAMRALAKLRVPVDSFFEDVLVNVEDEAVRANRLALLARIRAATGQVADFSRIAG